MNLNKKNLFMKIICVNYLLLKKIWVLFLIFTLIFDGKEITFTHKSRIFPKELNVNLTVPGQKKKKKKRVVIDQKQMVYYSEKYAKKQRRDREAMIVRAKDNS